MTDRSVPAHQPDRYTGLVVVVLFTLITWLSWPLAWSVWMVKGSSYSHGPLVIAIALWLLIQCNDRFFHDRNAPGLQRFGAILVGCAAGAIWCLGFIMTLATVQWLSLPIIFACMMIGSAQRAVRLAIAAPAIALYFALPVWELFVPMLQQLAVFVVTLSVKLLNIPAYIEGIYATIPGGRFVVEGGCSGSRYLLVALALSCLWSFLYIRDRRPSLMLIGASVMIALIFNWIRIFIIVAIGYYTQMKSPLVDDHELFGWLLFAVALVPIMFLGRRLEATRKPHAHDTQPKKGCWSLSKIVSCTLIIGALPLLTQMNWYFIEPTSMSDLPVTQSTSERSSVFGGWRPQFPGIDQWQPAAFDQQGFQILMGHLPKQTQHKELFAADNSFRPAKRPRFWSIQQQDHELIISNIYNQKWAIKVIYLIGGETTTTGISGQWTQLRRFLKGRFDGQVIFVGKSCTKDCSAALDQLRFFDPSELGVPSRI